MMLNFLSKKECLKRDRLAIKSIIKKIRINNKPYLRKRLIEHINDYQYHKSLKAEDFG